jgi:folate-binding protein YgfZ
MTDTSSGTTGVALAPALDGASLVDDLGSPTPGHYGDVAEEYRLLSTDAAVVDRSVRGAVLAVGPDARSFLDSLVSQDLTVLADGDGAHSLLLQPQGKLTADFRLLQIGAEEFWLDADVGAGALLAAGLNRFKIRVKVDVTDVTPEDGQLAIKGPNAQGRVADALGVAIPDRQHAHVDWRGARVVRADWPGLPGVDIVGRRDDVEAAWAALTAANIPRAGLLALEALRVEAGVPRQGHELDESTIPQEAFLERDAVSFTKGCFLGQELVCRIDTRGHVNRQLRGIVVEGDHAPAEGAEVFAGEKAVGRVTTMAHSPRLGIVGLAMLRREVEPGSAVTVTLADGRADATARELPLG